MPRFTLTLCLLGLLLPGTALAADALIARDYLRVLPTTIFDNTLEGMTEKEQRQLLENGSTEFWELHNENHNQLDVVARSPGDTVVALRIFRGGRGTLAVLGTVGGPLCTVELWRADDNGRIVPVDTPDEPGIREFLKPEHKVPVGVQPSMLFCVADEGLEARPVFWNDTGMVHMPVDFQVRYVWAGGQFKKTVEPLPTP